MASNLGTSRLTVTIKENIVLNGLQQGAETSTSINAIAEVYKRIMTVPVSAIEAGKFIVGDMKYCRITNLNTAAGEGVKLQIARDDDSNGTDDECAWILLEEGKSLILNTFDASFDANDGDLDAPTLDAITDIRALNESGSVPVDLEIFIAGT